MGEIKNKNNTLGGRAKGSDRVEDLGIQIHG
jgi:hypothetical protein